MSQSNQVTKLCNAISFFYKDDQIAPGLVISTLRCNNIYASVVRYNNDYFKGKRVICNVTAPTLDEAIVLLSKRFVEHTSQVVNPLEELKRSIIYR